MVGQLYQSRYFKAHKKNSVTQQTAHEHDEQPLLPKSLIRTSSSFSPAAAAKPRTVQPIQYRYRGTSFRNE